MKRKLLSLLLAVLLLTGCAAGTPQTAKQTRYEASFLELFDTVTTMVGYADSEEAFRETAQAIHDELLVYHQLYDIYNDYPDINNIKTINDHAGLEPVAVDRKIIDLLLFCGQMEQATGGMVNVAMGSVLSIWHDYREQGMDEPWNAKLPPMEQLQAAAQHTDISKIIIDEQACTVFLADPQMRLDVGAIAKGYAVEMIAEHMEEKGVSGYVLNVGGNVRTLGAKPDGSGWTVGVENPDEDATDYLAYLQLSGQSLITSGSYQRYYLVDGKRYHHIIDPATLMPANYCTSVSIVCPDSADGDALSTALFCLTVEQGLALIESLPDVEAMWLTVDGERHYSSGFSAYQTQQ